MLLLLERNKSTSSSGVCSKAKRTGGTRVCCSLIFQRKAVHEGLREHDSGKISFLNWERCARLKGWEFSATAKENFTYRHVTGTANFMVGGSLVVERVGKRYFESSL